MADHLCEITDRNIAKIESHLLDENALMKKSCRDCNSKTIRQKQTDYNYANYCDKHYPKAVEVKKIVKIFSDVFGGAT